MSEIPFESGLLNSIQYDAKYRGQIIKKKNNHYNGYRSSENYDLSEISDDFALFYQESKGFTPYKHQLLIGKRIINYKDTFISMCKGSGVRYAIDSAVIYKTIFNVNTTIYLTNNQDKSVVLNRVKNNVKSFRKHPFVNVALDCSNEFADIFVLTPNDLIILIKELNEESILNQVDHIVVEDIDTYNFRQISHLNEIIKIIKINKQQIISDYKPIQVTITSQPVDNKKDIASVFIDATDPDAIISYDDSTKNPFSVYYWMPSLETISESKKSKQFKVKRTPYHKDIAVLLEAINRTGNTQRVLLWRNGMPFTKHEKQTYYELLNKLKVSGGEKESLIIDVIDNLNQLNTFRNYDIIISVSVPKHIDLFNMQLGNLSVETGAVAFIILEESFLSTILLRSEKYAIESKNCSAFKLPKIFLSHNEKITSFYFLMCLWYVYKGQIIEINKLLDSYPGLKFDINHFIENKLLKEIKNDKNSTHVTTTQLFLNELAEKELKYGTTDNNNLVDLTFSDASEELPIDVERNIADIFFQNNMLIYYNQQYYKTSWLDDKQVLLTPQSEVNYICVPIINSIKTYNQNIIKNKKIISNSKGLMVLKLSGDLDIMVDGFKSFSYASFSETPVINENQKKVVAKERFYLQIELVGDDETKPSLYALTNLIQQFFTERIKGIDKNILISQTDNAILIIPLFQSCDKLIDDIYGQIEDLFDYLKNYTFDQLLYCICNDGCPLCVKNIYYQNHTNDHNISKNDLFLWLGIIKGEEILTREQIENRTKGVPVDRFKEILIYWKEKIIEIFRDRFSMVLEPPAQIFAANDLGSNIIGLYSNGKVEILSSIGQEKNVVEVIAHEYAHNWQFVNNNMHKDLMEKNLPYNGKIFIEGFAQWVAFRTMDFYGLHENMTNVTLRGVDVPDEGDEYGVGFMLCRYIEENFTGFSGLIEFMKTGVLKDVCSGNSITIQELLDDRFHLGTRKGDTDTHLSNNT